MKSFWLTANLDGASITVMMNSKRIDQLVSDWDEAATKTKIGDVREASRQFIVEALLAGTHGSDNDIGRLVAQALLWLTVTGPLGERLVPLLREGGPNMKVHQEITEIGKSPEGNVIFNFRTTVDDGTSAQLAKESR